MKIDTEPITIAFRSKLETHYPFLNFGKLFPTDFTKKKSYFLHPNFNKEFPTKKTDKTLIASAKMLFSKLDEDIKTLICDKFRLLDPSKVCD